MSSSANMNSSHSLDEWCAADDSLDYDLYELPPPYSMVEQGPRSLSSVNEFDYNGIITIGPQDHQVSVDDHSSVNGVVSHGFFLGTETMLNCMPSAIGKLADDSGSKLSDEDRLNEVYMHGEFYQSMRGSQHSFKQGREPTEQRGVLSKRIGSVGNIGQNMGLGHRIGILAEDKVLMPEAIVFDSSNLIITEDSPVQHNLSWRRPDNAAKFKTLVYDIEMETTGKWRQLNSVCHHVFRLYHLDNILFIGRHQVNRQKSDVVVTLRMACRGELTSLDGPNHWTQGPWSEIVVTFVGYANEKERVNVFTMKKSDKE